ncbi:BlaR1 family beta-lactam sensor/signal transducer [Halobacillus amylolyticus]|uniref:BlaR1 family beta-lactam sensor/signal transducer n=1 Tax=Halobacillus amylolyticus TaxID=2932259 RepID=A0ABY4H6P4_9BACI|nr:BlaR1 family beta-lactam sensor/signal transducer [Halobacillus amylolyticus]UOR10249.1 BlaR1 family beta-lactam sensor/signal transducer [Halobacillus amylolyticus]
MFFTHLVTSFIVSSITIVMIMLMKKLCSKHLSAKWQYNLWFLLLIALTLPFLPKQWIRFENFYISFDGNHSNSTSNPSVNTGEGSGLSSENWMQDFTVSVNRLNLDFLNITLASIWIAGMLVMAAFSLHAWFRLKKIRNTTTVLNNEELLQLFERCKDRLNISKPLFVGESPLVKSPMTFGLFKTYVVLPIHLDERMSIENINYIFMHELHHYKYKDIATNYLVIIYQILYWFNPLVWIAFKEMRVDREIACDTAVLKSLVEKSYADYGNTIISFVDVPSYSKNFTGSNQLNGPKKQIKKRIEKIASFTIESKWMKLKSISIFTLAGIFVASQLPFISAMANGNNRYDFNFEHTIYKDLSEYFGGYDGSFVLYNMNADQYTIYNKDKSTWRVSPNSTYKIYTALMGLELGVITSNYSTMKWNGTQYPYESWNTDQNLSTAMENSVTWYFKKLDQKIPRETVRAYLKQIGYGNRDLSGGEDYWLESSLKISPVEQVQLLSAFYTNQFEFEEKNIQTVKDSLLLEEYDGARLFGKTGTGNVNGKNINGWFIGYVEYENNTYFFATNIQNEDNSYGSKAAKITLSILEDKGISKERE